MSVTFPALRTLTQSPGYAAAAALTLALGIGTAMAMFSVLHASLLQPLPYADADRLVRFRDEYAATGGSGAVSTPNFFDLQQATRSVSQLAAYAPASYNIAAGDRPARVAGLRVTANFFATLGVGPALGRGFVEDEDRAGRADIAVISHRMWQDQFDGDAGVLARTLLLDGRAHAVVGVLPPEFWFPGDPGVIVPFAWTPEMAVENRGNRWLEGLARVAPGATAGTVHAELNAHFAQLAEAFPDSNTGWGIWTAGFGEWALGSSRRSLLLLNGAVLLLLGIATANVANLALVRAERRARETAVRAALGASRARLTRQFLGEGLLLGAIGAALGVAVAAGTQRVLLAMFGDTLPRAATVTLSMPVLSFGALLAMVVGLGVGLAPALGLGRRHIYNTLRSGDRGHARGGSRLQRAIVVGEVAVAVLIVTGAGLLINSFVRLNAVEPGVRVDDTLVFSIQLPSVGYDTPEATGLFYERALDAIHAVPGVVAAGVSERAPLQGGLNITTLRSPDDASVAASFVEIRTISPRFLEAAGIPLLAGRTISADDVAQARRVVVVSDVLARTLFGESDPLGRTILSDWDGGYQVVGVSASVREFGITRDLRPAIYWPMQALGRSGGMVFVVHTRAPVAEVVPAIRAGIARLDGALPLYDVRTMRDVVIQTTGSRWLATRLFSAFGTIALLLAALGIFGVLAYGVEQRTREIGIRMALGATAGSVLRMVVGQGLRVVGGGLVLGLAAAMLASRLLEDLLWEIESADPLTMLVVSVVAIVTATGAALLPATRATRIEPAQALARE